MWIEKEFFKVVGGTSAASVRPWSLAEGRSMLWPQPQYNSGSCNKLRLYAAAASRSYIDVSGE